MHAHQFVVRIFKKKFNPKKKIVHVYGEYFDKFTYFEL
jgi:hypothetical protein